MERGRLVGVTGPGGPGSGYAVGGRLVLTSAHVVALAGGRVEVFRPGLPGVASGRVVWCGTPGGRDDAALVLVDDDPAGSVPAGSVPLWSVSPGTVRWGRLVTDLPGTGCETWGVADHAQRSRAGAPVEAVQVSGLVNSGTGFAGNRYVVDLVQHPPRWSSEEGSPENGSPWDGMSGAAVFCDRMLLGVVASDRAHSGHGQLNAVPAYVLFHDPAFLAALAEHAGGRPGLEAVEFQSLADDTDTTGAVVLRSPAALLQAGRQTVPFHGREQVLEHLVAWCGRAGFGARLVHGPGGQGKTRLAHRLGHLLAADGWAVLWPHSDATPERLHELRHAARPLLVVLDYAETRTAQLAALVEAAAGHSGAAPFKVLLLARTDGDWWTRAKSATRLAEEHLDGAPAQLLAPLEGDRADRPRAYRDAVLSLAAALPRVDGCADTDWRAASGALPVPALDRDGYGNALTLHMTALADLLDTAAPPDPDTAAPEEGAGHRAEGVEDRLLGHERRYWEQTAATRGLTPGLGDATLETALAAAHLVGAADREQADRAWRALPALADQPRDRRDAVTAWIGALYPPTAPGRPWGALQPDRLAERHLGCVLDTAPDLAERLLRVADRAQKAQLLTVYARVAAHTVFDRRLDTALTDLCVRHPGRLVAQTITTATRTDHPGPLVDALDILVDDPATSLGDLLLLYDRFPRSSRRLARTAVRLARNITDHHRVLAGADPDAHLPGLALALTNLSSNLAAVGRREESLTAGSEAVEIRRVLAGADPDTHLPGLALALNNLAIWWGAVGRLEEGLAASREAVGHYRVLAGADPDARLPDLAASLTNLSIRLAAVGRGEEGLAVGREAVGYYRVLAGADPDARLPDLAATLTNLSINLAAVGRGEEGLAANREAVGHYRVLAGADPDAHLPDFATCLTNLSVRLGEVGRWEEGLTVIREAVGIRRVLAGANPDAYLPKLARSLNSLSVRLGEVGRWEEGLTAGREAVGIHRVLAGVNAEAHLPDFAASLNNLSIQLGQVGRREEGLAVIREAVEHYRALAALHPARFGRELKKSLEVAALLEALPRP
ncbi:MULTISPECIES: tetratricopeptide repeat protein [unclassified Streptomyces]|uniref:tetratricopeptide repeat protein n=1 Tax=unclassified Streptomyces TaxID=2593676 RepID=UPI0033B59DB1